MLLRIENTNIIIKKTKTKITKFILAFFYRLKIVETIKILFLTVFRTKFDNKAENVSLNSD